MADWNEVLSTPTVAADMRVGVLYGPSDADLVLLPFWFIGGSVTPVAKGALSGELERWLLSFPAEARASADNQLKWYSIRLWWWQRRKHVAQNACRNCNYIKYVLFVVRHSLAAARNVLWMVRLLARTSWRITG